MLSLQEKNAHKESSSAKNIFRNNFSKNKYALHFLSNKRESAFLSAVRKPLLLLMLPCEKYPIMDDIITFSGARSDATLY